MVPVAPLVPILLAALPQDLPADVVELRFAWPAEGSVRVREETFKKGRNAVSTYLLRWAPADDGSGTLIEYADFEIVSIEGLDRSSALGAAALREAEALASALPRLRVDEEGFLTELVGFEETVERMLEALSRVSGGDALVAKVGQSMRDPRMRQMMEMTIAETWNAWVANWIGVEVERGTEEVWEMDVSESGGVTSAVHVRYGELAEHRGLDCVEIAMEGDADEELLRRKTLEMLGLIAEGVDVELPDDLPIQRMTRTDTAGGIYAVKGLRPIETYRTTTVRVWETGAAEAREQIERHEYAFEWSDLEED